MLGMKTGTYVREDAAGIGVRECALEGTGREGMGVTGTMSVERRGQR